MSGPLLRSLACAHCWYTTAFFELVQESMYLELRVRPSVSPNSNNFNLTDRCSK